MKQMTLGGLITILQHKDPELFVCLDFVHFRPQGIHSYRGYYDQLAIGYGTDDITVAQLLELCKDADGKTFTGYKGGDYNMHSDTPLWIANSNESGSTAIVDVQNFGWCVRIITAAIDD